MIRAILCCLLLAGCATKTVVKEVKVPVSVPCLKAAPAKPDYQFGRGDMPASADAAKLLAKDFEAAKQYGTDWEAAAAGCAALIGPT